MQNLSLARCFLIAVLAVSMAAPVYGELYYELASDVNKKPSDFCKKEQSQLAAGEAVFQQQKINLSKKGKILCARSFIVVNVTPDRAWECIKHAEMGYTCSPHTTKTDIVKRTDKYLYLRVQVEHLFGRFINVSQYEAVNSKRLIFNKLAPEYKNNFDP